MLVCGLMVVTVVAWVVGSHTRFMLAITSHCCPAELQGQQSQQKDCHPLFHPTNLTGVAIISQCPVFLRGDSNAVVFESPTSPKNDAFLPERVIYTIALAPPAPFFQAIRGL